jgi:hypothetical protein
MASQSLAWMALPNGLTQDGTGIRVSVMLVPRLNPEGDQPQLESFPEWLDWPATLANATFEVAYGGVTASVPSGQTVGADRVDDTIGLADSTVWKALFGRHLLVRAGDYRDLTSKHVVSYETTGVANLVSSLYGSLAASAGDDLPTIGDLMGNDRLELLVETLRGADGKFTDQATGIRNTRRQFQDYRLNRLNDIGQPAASLARAELFHTPPSRQRNVTQRRRDDPRIDASYRTHDKPDLPNKDDFAKQLDFHQIVGAMNSYPTVLRRLGIVIDLVLSRDRFGDSADAPLTVAVTFAPGALTVARKPDMSPVTHAVLSAGGFFAVPDPSPASAAARVVDGLLELDPGHFELLQVDVDAAGLKVMNFARSLGHILDQGIELDAVTRKQRQLGAPALRTAGMMLVQRDRGQALEARFARNASTNGQAQAVIDGQAGATAPELWAEDLVRGFRFDVWDATTTAWRSLCRRTARYDVGQAGVIVEPSAGEEESTVRLAATQSSDDTTNQDLLWLHEAVVAWTGWSLAAPPPGRSIRPDDGVGAEAQTEAEVPPGLHFSSRFSAVPGSLPRLRFGRRYWIRARSVDLAGNSLAPTEKDLDGEDPNANASPFLRYEPLAAPVLALVRSGGVTEKPSEGESVYRMAIRSFNDVPADNAVPTGQTARRFAVPQQVSVREAEQHGMLDRGGRVDPTTFDMLANQKDRSADDPAASLVAEVIPTKGPLDEVPVKTTFAVYKDGAELTYLPDPLAREVAVRFFGIEGVDPRKVVTIPLYEQDDWPAAAPFKIELLESHGDPPAFDAASRTLRVPLDKGNRAQLRLSMTLTPGALDLMGIWHWVPSPTPDLERRALEGQHWMLTPWHTLELVHAVQRPLLDPEFTALGVNRTLGQTCAQPRFRAKVSIKSTDRLDLLADWHEPLDDVGANQEVDRHRTDTAFSVKLTTADDYAGTPDHRISGPDEIDVGLEWRSDKRHEFHDTRYRRIEYQLLATTKFREYLPASVLTDAAGKPTEEKIRVLGKRRVTWVPSSAPPPAPDVLCVVPTFGWTRSRTADGEVTSQRSGGGLRVYLNRPWNASGYGEMLAVVLAPSSFTGEPETDPEGHPYKKLVTQWGNDPIWASPFVAGIAPTRANFPRARTAPDPAGGWLPAGAPATEADQPPGGFIVTGLGPGETPLEIAPHDVFRDDARQLWYCDIEIDQGDSYWPMIRLALARYHPVSVGGAELSEIVLADILPLVADRWLNLTRQADGSLELVVVGNAFNDSSGHREAAQAPAYSTYNRLTGETHDYEPAHVSPTTVIEVWVEALDPSQGEDFGWGRVAAQVTPSGGPSLWQGTVVPPAGLDARLRLVVAEYEEYLVDDDSPYDRVPESKGRRLVYVEHVELG